MNILLLGSGGRENALAWKISQSPLLTKLFIAPGNPGTANYGTNVPIDASNFELLGRFSLENAVEMVVVGPENPLVEGIVDYFETSKDLSHILMIGPSKHGAQLEGSKDFAKEFMLRHNIPTAAYKTFTSSTYDAAIQYLECSQPPYVLKADGLAAGKGVVICQTFQEASAELQQMILNRRFGVASDKVVIEQFLQGVELSVFVLTDGISYVLLPEAKDYKRIGEGDTGPNTGGMGAISPVPFADAMFMQKLEDRIIKPTIQGLAAEKISYKGFVFFGLINVAGEPFVIEYNVRMGDPETEVVMPRLKSDLVELLIKTAKGELHQAKVSVYDECAVTIMMVSGGYPGSFAKGFKINGLADVKGSMVFHAGTQYQNNDVVTSGGRVLAVTSLAQNFGNALEASYMNVNCISYNDAYYRTDIGKDFNL
jgi:phosphoribosylamine--glycine ligase